MGNKIPRDHLEKKKILLMLKDPVFSADNTNSGDEREPACMQLFHRRGWAKGWPEISRYNAYVRDHLYVQENHHSYLTSPGDRL